MCGARRLRLHLIRRKNNKWLHVDETAVRELVNGVITNGIEEIIQRESMNALETLQHYLPLDNNPTQPPQDRIHVLVVVPTEALEQRQWKKASVETSWVDALRRQQMVYLPFDLHGFLSQLSIKIPISDELLSAMQHEDDSDISAGIWKKFVFATKLSHHETLS